MMLPNLLSSARIAPSLPSGLPRQIVPSNSRGRGGISCMRKTVVPTALAYKSPITARARKNASSSACERGGW
eukprot:6331556-Prymnesium_polylepis.1